MKTNPLHLTSGDIAGKNLQEAGLPGEVLVWHDILYDGPRRPGWPEEENLAARAEFVESATGGGLSRALVLDTFREQYRRLAEVDLQREIVLWFDACLFDQAMLTHILTCLGQLGARQVALLCIDAFPGIVPYNGIGQLSSAQLASRYGQRRPVSEAQFRYAALVDRAFATQDRPQFAELAQNPAAPLPWVPAAVRRWLVEQADPATGLGRLESLALAAVRSGCTSPGEICAAVAAADTPPRYWGDTTLWAKLNGLAERQPPLLCIAGPTARLPQWESSLLLKEFKITPA